MTLQKLLEPVLRHYRILRRISTVDRHASRPGSLDCLRTGVHELDYFDRRSGILKGFAGSFSLSCFSLPYLSTLSSTSHRMRISLLTATLALVASATASLIPHHQRRGASVDDIGSEDAALSRRAVTSWYVCVQTLDSLFCRLTVRPSLLAALPDSSSTPVVASSLPSVPPVPSETPKVSFSPLHSPTLLWEEHIARTGKPRRRSRS